MSIRMVLLAVIMQIDTGILKVYRNNKNEKFDHQLAFYFYLDEP